MINNKEEKFKILLLGGGACGKTCIVSRYTKGIYDSDVTKSNSPNYSSKGIKIGNKSIVLDIWDTPGDESRRDLLKMFYKDANAIVLVYDITSKDYFEDLKDYWFSKLRKSVPREASKN